MHERELFGGRVRARSLGDEPVMHAKRVRSVRHFNMGPEIGGYWGILGEIMNLHKILPRFYDLGS